MTNALAERIAADSRAAWRAWLAWLAARQHGTGWPALNKQRVAALLARRNERANPWKPKTSPSAAGQPARSVGEAP